MELIAVEGQVAPGWEAVADVFEQSLSSGVERGAAVAIYYDGECVVDLWGGVADARSGGPWSADTVVPVFSSTKGATAVCAHLLVERGLLDLDASVADYWPEFAQAGKEDVSVRWLLSHQAGLPYVDDDLTLDDLRQEAPVLRALERQAPLWEPGACFAYHAVTFGHLVGELIRRISGLPLARFFAQEVGGPLGLRSWMAIPVDAELPLARLERVEHEVAEPIRSMMGPDSAFVRSITLGSALPLSLVTGEPGDFNDREVLAITLGGSSMVSDARSLARMYAACTTGVDGIRLLSADTVRAAREVQTLDLPYFRWPKELPGHPMDFGLGFMASAAVSGETFGHGGAGGSLGLGDLTTGIGFGYVMNRMDAAVPDTRATSLLSAAVSCTG